MTESNDDRLTESKPLKRLLTSLAQNYYDGEETIEVRWTSKTAHADMDGRTPVVNLNVDSPYEVYGATGSHALRLLVDTLSHEVQHHNDSEIEGKGEFMERHNDGYAKLAGMVINVLEDNHIDYNRHREFRGLKKVHDWAVSHQMKDDDRRPPMGDVDPRDQVVQGFVQLAFAGKVKGLSDADEDVREALMDVAPICEKVKQEDDPEARTEMAHEVTLRLKEVIPAKPDMPDWLADLIRDLMEDLERRHFDPDDAPEDEEFDPEEAEQEAEDQEGDGGSGGEGEDGEESDEDAEGQPADGETEQDGDGDETTTTTVRELRELTGGREDAGHIRLE